MHFLSRLETTELCLGNLAIPCLIFFFLGTLSLNGCLTSYFKLKSCGRLKSVKKRDGKSLGLPTIPIPTVFRNYHAHSFLFHVFYDFFKAFKGNAGDLQIMKYQCTTFSLQRTLTPLAARTKGKSFKISLRLHSIGKLLIC